MRWKALAKPEQDDTTLRCNPMKERRDRICRLSLAVASLLLSVGPSMAQNMPMPCSAIARDARGGWKVLAPVVFNVQGRLLAPTVGTTFAARSTTNGIEMSHVLNHQCRKAG